MANEHHEGMLRRDFTYGGFELSAGSIIKMTIGEDQEDIVTQSTNEVGQAVCEITSKSKTVELIALRELLGPIRENN